MRVTFVIPGANLSGGIRIVADHARILRERGHEVAVVAPRPRRPGLRARLRQGLRGSSPPMRSGPRRSHFDDLPGVLRRVRSRGRVVASDVPDGDVVIATWWETAEWVWRLPEAKGVKVNFLQGYEAHPGQPRDRIDAVWRLPMPKIVVSRWLADIAREQFGDHEALLVPNGTDTERFRFRDRVPEGERRFGAMGSGAGFKRFDLACAVAREVVRRCPAARFVGFSSGGLDGDRFPEASEFEIQPPQDRIAEIYGSCDCWLFMSDAEGYGLPVLEAMACGTPVVARPAGAAPELLAGGGGRLVDSEDPAELAQAVLDVLELPAEQWKAMSRRAREEAEQHSWERIGQEMEQALLSILEDAGRRPA